LLGWFCVEEVAVPVAPSTEAAPSLRLLAVPVLVLPGDALSPLERKDAALLALLAFDGPLSRQRAAALLWPDAEPQKARNSLRQRLFRLRRAAGVDLILEGSALALAPGVPHDLADLQARLDDDPAAAMGELLGAFGYEDCDELDDWVRSARERFRSRRRDALAAAAAREEAAARIARALLFAERLVNEDALSEQSHRLVMRLHYRRGDRAAALAAYARCRQALAIELHAEPGAETRELAHLIERAGTLPGLSTRPVPVSIAHPPRLIGRQSEWSAVEAAWSASRVALIHGDAGMGKTRLLTEFALRHAVPLVGARPGDERVPYALLSRVLRAALRTDEGVPVTDAIAPAMRSELARVLPELGMPPPGPLTETRFRQAISQVLSSRQLDGLAGIALDDLHFADEASLQMLPTLVEPGLRWVLATRAAEAGTSLAAWRAADSGGSLIDIELAPLTPADVRELLESLELDGIDPARLASPLAQHTGGNPFFVLETLGAMVARPNEDMAALPSTPSVGALIERRLAQLSPAALRLARVAALAGVDFDASLAAHALDAHPLDLAEAWNELERAQVLRGHAFAHDLVRDAVGRSVPAPIAELLHRSIADHLEERRAAPARIAEHCEAAGLWSRAARLHLQAADAARRSSRRSEEVTHREAAGACYDRAGNADEAYEARRSSVECVILVRGVEHARRLIDGLLAAARSDAQRSAALTAQAMAALMGGDHVTGVRSAQEALALASATTDPWARFEASRLLAVGLAQQGHADEAEALMAPFEAEVIASGTAEQRGHYWADLAYVLNSARRLRRTADALEHASECARELGDLAELATLTTNLATVHGNLGHVAQAHEAALRARALQVELGEADGPTSGVIEIHAGIYAAALGEYGAALQAYERALASFRRGGQALWIAVCANNLAAALIDLGQFARAKQALDYAPPPVSHVAARGATLAARIARELGASPAGDLERATGAGPDYYIGALLELERTETMAPVDALACCEAVQAAAEAREYGGIAMKARLLAARAALRAGDLDSALDRWQALQPLRSTLQAADCYPPLADAIGRDILLAHGDEARAAVCLATAIAWIRETALPHVPDGFRDSFLHRNPVNRALLTAETRRR
jgi:DNA-binding SARP family transcriptional activator